MMRSIIPTKTPAAIKRVRPGISRVTGTLFGGVLLGGLWAGEGREEGLDEKASKSPLPELSKEIL
ncbi:MAG: hypothetical protein IKB02_07520 [Clostridia bacterium]|nr:hypothetical protein [Clostridia bacterium]